MIVQISHQTGRMVVALKGSLNDRDIEQTVRSLFPVFDSEDCDVEIDCSQLDQLSDLGLSMFLELYKHVCSNGHHAYISHLQAKVKEKLSRNGLLQLYEMIDIP